MAIRDYNDASVGYNDLIITYGGNPRHTVSIDLWGPHFFLEAEVYDDTIVTESIGTEVISFLFIVESVIVHENLSFRRKTYGRDIEKYRPVGVVYELVGYGTTLDGSDNSMGTSNEIIGQGDSDGDSGGFGIGSGF